MFIERKESGYPPFRVLCVDDYRDCADSLVMLMEAIGFEAIACYDGRTALDLNDSFRTALCFVDLNMPRMDGDVLARKLLANEGWRPLLVVAMRAMSDEVSNTRTSSAGFQMHLVKPVDPRKLIDVIDALFISAEANSATRSRVSENRPNRRA